MLLCRVNCPVDINTLQAIEEGISIKLTIQYRNFLLKYNGGETKKKIFLFKNSKDDGSILDRLFGIVPDKCENLLLYVNKYYERIPKNCIPIGADPGSNLILLSVKGPDRGKIYFWDHEMEADEGQEPDYSNLTLIADSFDEFINNLHSEDEIQD